MVEIIRRYGLWGVLKLFYFKLKSKTISANIRIIRFPFDIRNRRNIKFGAGFTSGIHCRIEAHPQNTQKKNTIIEFGKNVQLNDYVHIVGIQQIKIGDNVLMASKIFISDCNHGSYKGEIQSSPLEIPIKRILKGSPIEIKKNSWLGEFVCIMPGVTIGEGSIIGAMSVVTKDIPDYCIAVGSPAQVIKTYNFSSEKWEQI